MRFGERARHGEFGGVVALAFAACFVAPVAPAAVPPDTAAAPTAAASADHDSAPRPTPVIGDTWMYRRVDLFTGLEVNRWLVRFLGSDASGLRFKTLGAGDFVTTPDLGRCNRSKDIPEVRCAGVYRFPLVLGAKTGYEKQPNADDYGHHSLDCIVAQRETVTVTAGTFDTFRVDCRGIWVSNGGELGAIFQGQLRQSYWYAPAVNTEVKQEIRAGKPKGGWDTQYAIELVGLRPAASVQATGASSPPARTEIESTTIAAATAPSPNLADYAGRWYGSVAIANGTEIGAEIVLAGESGSYRLIPFRAAVVNPCYGKSFPVHVTSATARELAFDVNEAELSPGCPNQSVTLRRNGADRLEGLKEDGRAVRLVR